eukprot:TRINITY_DN70220_c0_g1_i1.p1 TRINITY_DN70220_c0_g1~~TRINITY_DN70220_c0_g1_i1.p1  ORF type:complete len:916 (+),score=326.48 TRINITY_DN70220_c0_g1_i1:84-2750(+)
MRGAALLALAAAGAQGAPQAGACAQYGRVPVTGTDTVLYVCSDSTIRVTRAPAGTQRNSSLVVRSDWAKPEFTVSSDDPELLTVTTALVRAAVSKKTGAVTFYSRSSGAVLLQELSHNITKTADPVTGQDAYAVEQRWASPDGEALYGGGEYQNGLVNWKSAPLQIVQFNTEAAVPFFVSSLGYGILWDIYSWSYLNRPSEDMKLNFTAARNGKQTATFTAAAAGDYHLYFLGCDHGFGCGMGKVVDIQVQDSVTGARVPVQQMAAPRRGAFTQPAKAQTVQDWEKLTNLPDSITGRARGLVAGRTYTVELDAEGFGSPQVYLAPPSAQTSLSSELTEAGIDYYFMSDVSGSTGVDGVISAYRAATGPAPLYGKWVYGFWQCKEHYKTQKELLDAAHGFRNRSIPVDSFVQDWHYWGNLGWGPQWDPSVYPDPAGMVKELHGMDIHLMVSVWSKFDTQTVFWKNMSARGWIMGDSKYYDPYTPGARELFYQFSKTAHFDIGVDALWLDATEPEGFANRGHRTYYGSGEMYMNPYSLMTTQAIADGLRRDFPDAQGSRVFSLTRSSFLAQQRTGATLWSGDISGAWDSLRRQVAASTNYQMSGIPYWAQDIGGFFRPSNQYTTDDYHQMLTRWFQFGVFTPVFRVHGGGSNTELWNYGDQVQTWIVDSAINLRYRLLPYIYSGFARVDREGYTMQRHLVFDFAQDAKVLSIADQFMFGPAFLVSPIYTPGMNVSRSVYLPGGEQWRCFHHGKLLSGLVTPTVDITMIPVFVRAGSIVPLAPFMQHTGDSQDPTELRIYSGKDGRFTLYDDDGKSDTRAAGHAFSTIELSWADKQRVLTISARSGSYAGMPAARTFNVVVVSEGHGVGVAPEPHPDKVVQYTGAAVTVQL